MTTQNTDYYLAYFAAVASFYPPTPHYKASCPLCSAGKHEQRLKALADLLSAIVEHNFSDIAKVYRQIFYNIYDYNDSCPYEIQSAYYLVETTPMRFAKDYAENKPQTEKVLTAHANLMLSTIARRIINQHNPILGETPLGPITEREKAKIRKFAKNINKHIARKIRQRTPMTPLPLHCIPTGDTVEFLGATQKRPDRPLDILLTDMETIILNNNQQKGQTASPEMDYASECLSAIMAYAINNARFPAENAPMSIRERIKASPIANEMYHAIRDTFEHTYGRQQQDGDPLFPDFTSSVPKPMTPENVKDLISTTAEAQGICPLALLGALQIGTAQKETATLLHRYFAIPEKTISLPGFLSYGFITPTTPILLRDSHAMIAKLKTGMLWLHIKKDSLCITEMTAAIAGPNFVGQYQAEGKEDALLYVFTQLHPLKQTTDHTTTSKKGNMQQWTTRDR